MTRFYITAADPTSFPWMLDSQPASFLQILLAELGSLRHLDRLTIYQARPNLKKGSVSIYNFPTMQTLHLTHMFRYPYGWLLLQRVYG